MTKRKSTPAPEPAVPATASTNKLQALTNLLGRPQGARIDEMMAATGWQAHSVRGAMSGTLKKGRGLAIVSEKVGTERIYRILQETGA